MSGFIRISNGAPITANSRRLFFSSSLLALPGSDCGFRPNRRLRNHPNPLCAYSAPLATNTVREAFIK